MPNNGPDPSLESGSGPLFLVLLRDQHAVSPLGMDVNCLAVDPVLMELLLEASNCHLLVAWISAFDLLDNAEVLLSEIYKHLLQ